MSILAYIDESGQPSQTLASSDHFVVSAVLVRAERAVEMDEWVLRAKAAVNRQAHHELHWNKIASAEQRDRLTTMLGAQEWGISLSVIACKRHLPRAAHLDDDGAYLYAVRYLIERASWFGRHYGQSVDLTIAHRIRFKRSKLEEYDSRLRADGDCQIDWNFVDLAAARLDQPKREPRLQVADLVASSTASAFEPDRHGAVHPRYVQNYANRIWRGPAATSRKSSYGLKMHPWSATTRAAYPWVAAL